MVDKRRAVRAWEAHLEEVIGVDEATAIADRFDRVVTREYLDAALNHHSERIETRLSEHDERIGRLEVTVGELRGEVGHLRGKVGQLRGELAASWRRDLLLISVGQFFALAAAVAVLVTLGG